ncbi:hypothetical protein KUTeg_013344 [Tegillarca granosa]|uniref:NADH dehydrogenase subunit 4L n=1 Tax=Tegillarca granosa TaxID=220873 RepID=A0ABQ9EXE4_TEGGR|nr:hypothetical protein KUTeg_013344 [Tegillarca granosa]
MIYFLNHDLFGVFIVSFFFLQEHITVAIFENFHVEIQIFKRFIVFYNIWSIIMFGFSFYYLSVMVLFIELSLYGSVVFFKVEDLLNILLQIYIKKINKILLLNE